MKELLLEVNRNSDIPLYIQIYKQIRLKIMDGSIKAKQSLPSIRKLSEQLHVNKATLESAYGELVTEGLIESRPRSGYFVLEVDVDFFTSKEHTQKAPLKTQEPFYPYDFHLDEIDTLNFPLSTWRKITHHVLSYEEDILYRLGDPQGELGLREEIAHYVSQTRGVNCVPNQVVVGSHSQILLHLIGQILCLHGKTVAVGEPGYSLTTNTFEKMGCQIASVQMDKDGFKQENLDSVHANIVFVSPSFQFPLGSMMTIQKRIELLKWATERNAFIIEDDYLSELRYSGDLIPSLQSLDQENRVIYMGTFHRTLLPSISIGYIILPSNLLDAYYKNHFHFQQTTSRIEQKTLELFMKLGHYEEHRFKMKELYRKKYIAMVNAIETYFKQKAIILKGETGLHVTVEVITEINEDELIRRAKNAGVNFTAYRNTWYRKDLYTHTNPTFLLGFGGMTVDQINKGVDVLYQSWFN
ncbi:PLP-dependent aminotransferase family protein [Bacillus sp. 31A1R]|uniref:PLP-dependent aminotransferase family protein n=1 Tax=Robertmurraya mangrovi TaxID=3098077 RepID=A0ABU5IW79_9BACI|nr:PLP-dependent aminotransferase family protein [Bacillus sp. 31A1R]MDZ5471385.1 PLP-dependent aminotransferase family protein [Bacillus sp. 31A1R]